MPPRTAQTAHPALPGPAPLEGFLRAGLAGSVAQGRRGAALRCSGRWLDNFASSDYLGLGSHPLVIAAACQAARRWGLSLGMPAVLAVPALSGALEARFARLAGQESALLLPSTTHLALDLLPQLAGRKGVILLDEWAYPISLDGARAASQRGARLARFAHNDPSALERALQIHSRARPAIIVVDGVYSAGGTTAPLAGFARLAAQYNALIYVDDAHGIGVLGANPRACPPYGLGGGGSPVFAGLPPGRVLHVASLSKAFGAPLALVAGPSRWIEPLRRHSEARVHSSPPAVPVTAAALAALRLNEQRGDALRARLTGRVQQFIQAAAAAGLQLLPNHSFPIQTIYYATPQAAFSTAARLHRAGLLAAVNLHPPDHPHGGAVRFILSAQHTPDQVERAARLLSSSQQQASRTGSAYCDQEETTMLAKSKRSSPY